MFPNLSHLWTLTQQPAFSHDPSSCIGNGPCRNHCRPSTRSSFEEKGLEIPLVGVARLHAKLRVTGLHPKRTEDRPVRVSTSKGLSHNRNLRATLDQPHHPLLGKTRTTSGGIKRCRSMVSRAAERKPAEKAKTLSRSNDRQIRRIMSLVYKHGQRHNYVPRQQEGNPMNWVSQRTTSDYRAVIMTPKQAFEVLLNIPEPRRTLTLSDAATALRVSELLGLMWMDLDFEGLVIYVRRAYVWGRFKEPKSKASKAPVPMHPLLAGFLLAWHERTKYTKESDYVFPSVKLRGKKPLSA